MSVLPFLLYKKVQPNCSFVGAKILLRKTCKWKIKYMFFCLQCSIYILIPFLEGLKLPASWLWQKEQLKSNRCYDYLKGCYNQWLFSVRWRFWIYQFNSLFTSSVRDIYELKLLSWDNSKISCLCITQSWRGAWRIAVAVEDR